MNGDNNKTKQKQNTILFLSWVNFRFLPLKRESVVTLHSV